jgi:uncharacterized membrane protein YeaQ/YmgE (transglycosylase-associated protein family)
LSLPFGYKTYFIWRKRQSSNVANLCTDEVSEVVMNIIAWIILGILAGAIAKAIYPGTQGGGILATMILGIIGAFIGGSLYTLLQTGTLQLTATTFSLPGLFIAVIGAIIAIFLWGLFQRRSNV